MKTYTIKLEDKIAFLNKLDKLGVKVKTSQIKNDIADDPHSFTITFNNDEDIEKVETILDQSSKINQIKEALRKLVREELKK
jgi:hypothetical protein